MVSFRAALRYILHTAYHILHTAYFLANEKSVLKKEFHFVEIRKKIIVYLAFQMELSSEIVFQFI